MSSIDRLQISGIRSFGPDHPQQIKFQKPLTILVGHNGSGKTSVVECLKYACSGDMPPGVKGGNFIQDPKISGETEVKAQVKLEFKDVANERVVIIRSMQATQKQKRTEFKTLESVMKRKNPKTRENISISSKCADLDAAMVESLGVSKAVINNVIFCHQEDSCWPLGEGKALKTKFDDIFDATKYNKALDSIRKTKKTQDDDSKKLHLELKYLQQLKEQVARKKDELSKEEIRLLAQEDTIQKHQADLTPIADKIAEIDSRWKEFHDVETKIAKLKTEEKGIQKNIADTKAQLQSELSESLEELEAERRQFDRSVRDKEAEKDGIQRKVERAQREQKTLQADGSKLQIEQGRLEEREKDLKAKQEHRRSIVSLKSTELKLEGFESSQLTDSDVDRFIALASEKRKALVQQIHSIKAEYHEEEQQFITQIDAKAAEKTKLETTANLKNKSVEEFKREIAKIDRKLKNVETMSSQMESLNVQLSKVEEQLAGASQEMDAATSRETLKDMKEQINSKEQQLRKLYDEKGSSHSQNSMRKDLESLKADLSEKDIAFRRIFVLHENFMKTEFQSMPEENFRHKVDKVLDSLSTSVQQKSHDLQQKNISSGKKQQQIQTWEDQLAEKEQAVKEFQDKLEKLSSGQDLAGYLKVIEDQITEVQTEKGAMEGEKSLYALFEANIKKDVCCPICMRDFDNKSAAEEVVADLSRRVQSQPAKMKMIVKKLEKLQESHKKGLQLQSEQKPIDKYLTKDIPDLRKLIETLKSEVTVLKDSIDTIEDELNTLTTSENMAKQMQSDAGTMDNLKKEMKRISVKLEDLQAKLPQGGKELRSPKEIQVEIETVQKEKDDLTNEYDTLEEQLRTHERNVTKLRDKVNKLTQQKLYAQKDDHERVAIVDKKESLLADIKKCEAEVKAAKEQKEPLESEIASLRSQKAEVLDERDVKVANLTAELDKIKATLNDLDSLGRELEKNRNSIGDRHLDRVTEELQSVKTQLREKESIIQQCHEQLRNLQQDLDGQQTRQRNILDNIRVRELEVELKEIQKALVEQQKKLGNVDSSKMAQERQNLIVTQQKLQSKLSEAKGTIGELKAVIKRYQRDLSTEPLSTAMEKFRDVMINYKVTEAAAKDLQKYAKALDAAIMKFHNMKMAEINKTIKDLWISVYKGSDIDYIEIKAEEDDSESDRRRAFNYRVVLHTKDAELDMRGRCSAGQKILASLLIRIALAETFSTGCGVLALDEPTTNLDRENVVSLAETLLKLVRDRSSQKNMQLVVITHDEEFVQLLLQEGLTDQFYKVSKNLDGFSELQLVDNISDLRD